MADLSVEQIEQAIATYREPSLDKDLISAKQVKNIDITDGVVTVNIELGFPAKGIHDAIKSEVANTVSALEGVSSVQVNISTKIVSHSVQKGIKPLPEVKNIIAVASGKGGVGKSTTAVNLALALQAEGANVGILDADIYGPSLPTMLNCKGSPDSPDGKSIEPKISYQLQVMSIGNLVDEESPMIWRGPMVTGALEQLLNDTNWKEVDYLIIDLPPGTGDIQLTMSQKIPVSTAVIVTTPQDISLLDARKALKMFEKVDVPVSGIVENMSTHVCTNCGHEEAIFGAGGGKSMAQQYNVELLGSLPLDINIRQGMDNGQPIVVMDPESAAALTYRDIARKVSAKLSLRARDYAGKFPKIVIRNS